MKNFILGLMILLSVQICTEAKNIKVEAMSDFSTTNPPKTWQVKIVEDVQLKTGQIIPAESVLEGKIAKVKGPTRGKRNATFQFIPQNVYTKGKIYETDNNYIGKYSALSDISAAGIAKQGVVLVGNKLADGLFGPGLAVAEGVVQNKTGNVAKSVAVSVYESSPLSYLNKGKEIKIEKGQQFVMNFKKLDEEY